MRGEKEHGIAGAGGGQEHASSELGDGISPEDKRWMHGCMINARGDVKLLSGECKDNINNVIRSEIGTAFENCLKLYQ